MGAPKWPPSPRTLVAPRRSRGAPPLRAAPVPTWPPSVDHMGGPEMAPEPPDVRGVPRSRGTSISLVLVSVNMSLAPWHALRSRCDGGRRAMTKDPRAQRQTDAQRIGRAGKLDATDRA